jgi:DNA-binding transcriptional LysR family regulator
LIDAFTRRFRDVEVALQVEPAGSFAGLLADRVADVCLGPRAADVGFDAAPFLRYRLVVVAAPGHWLAGRRAVPAASLAGERWLVGPSGAAADTDAGSFLARHRLAPEDVRAFPSDAAAVMGAESGRGVMLAVAHTVMAELRRGTLVRLDVRGTPAEGLWHATTLPVGRRPDVAGTLRRFITTPEAVQAMLARPVGVKAGRFKPPVYVALWHS